MKFRAAFAIGALVGSASGCNCNVVGIINAGGKIVVVPQTPFGVAATTTAPIMPASIAFGATPVGSVSEETVQVKNEGRGAVIVKSIALEMANDDVAITQILTGNCDGSARSPSSDMTIMGNTCATFVVRYGPHSQTAMSGTIDLIDNQTGNTTVKIPISGNGVGGTIQVCLLDPTSGMSETSSCYPTAAMPPTVAFGPVAVGNMSVLKVRINNTGKYGLTITGAYISSMVADFSLIGGATLNTLIAPGMHYDVAIQFNPMANAMETASLIIPSNDTVNPSVTVPITGTAQGPCLKATPNPLAFGSITTGTNSTKTIDLFNCGSADYSFTQLELVNNQTNTVFTIPAGTAATLTDTNGTMTALASMPTLPYDFPPGTHLTVNIEYAPTVQQTPPAGDSAYLSIKTTYERTTVPITGNGGFPGCSSSGANLAPTAAIRVENPAPVVVDPTVVTFDPLTNVTLNAQGSTAPAPETISAYNWTLVSQPSGSQAMITGSGAIVTLFMEIVGDYVVSLTVSTNDMCQSPPVEVTLHVISHAAIHIQLTWPQAYGDFDLHYSEPGGTLYETSPFDGDLFYIYSQASACGTTPPNLRGGGPTVTWGSPPTAGTVGPQDPTQDVDQLFGYGPENDTQQAPFDGTYTVRVVFYAWDSCGGGTQSSYNPATAVINIFANGVLIWHGSQANMSPCDVWDAATITVANNGTTITSAAILPVNIYTTGQCG